MKPTNICCLDLQQDCIDYLRDLGFSVYEGSLGSVYRIKWDRLYVSGIPIVPDYAIPENYHEYHVFIHDMNNIKTKEYITSEHDVSGVVDNPSRRFLECSKPITLFDSRPFGVHVLNDMLGSLGNKSKQISIVFVNGYYEVEYHSNMIAYNSPEVLGEYNNYEAWNMPSGQNQFGKRVKLADDTSLSFELFNEHLDSTEYYYVFHLPTVWDGKKRVPDKNFVPLLFNEGGECVSYLYCHPGSMSVDIILPQVSDKQRLLSVLFERVLFRFFSEFFPDVEAGQWISNEVYELPEETAIRERIETKKREFENVIKELETEANSIKASKKVLKDLLTSSGDDLVSAVKSFLEYLGFENVVDKDKEIKAGEIKEEDLTFDYKGNSILMEVKGINGTSTDSECSQIDKVVLRRIQKQSTKLFHGVYVVNNQRNVEPLKRQTPPFNETQIKDAESMRRTMSYTPQLFALYSDIENGYISKEDVRDSFLTPGLLRPHDSLISLGVPEKFFSDRTILCFHLKDVCIRKRDKVFFFDDLHRMVGAEILDIQIDKVSVESAISGEVSIKVSKAFPRSREVFVKKP